MTEPTASTVPNPVLLNDNWYLDTQRNVLRCSNRSYDAEHQLFVVLAYFVRHQQQVLPKEQLLRDNWPGKIVNDENLTVAISKLRKIFSDNAKQPAFIKTVPGVGYQFIASVQPVPSTTHTQAKAGKSHYTLLFATAILMGLLALSRLVTNDTTPLTNSVTALPATADVQHSALIAASEQADAAGIPALLQQWRSVLQQDPDHIDGYWHLAQLKLKLLHWQVATDSRHFAELDSLLQKVVSLEPGHAKAWGWLAKLHFWHRQDYPLSEQYFRRALAIEATAETYYAFAEMLLAQGQHQQALDYATKARNLLPHHYAFPGLAWLYQLSGAPEQAWQELQRIRQTEQETGLWHASALRISHQLGLQQQSFDLLVWLLSQSEEGWALLLDIKHLYQQQGITAVYQLLLEQKFVGDIGHYQPPLSWSRYAILAGDNEAALHYLEQATQQFQLPYCGQRLTLCINRYMTMRCFKTGCTGSSCQHRRLPRKK